MRHGMQAFYTPEVKNIMQILSCVLYSFMSE